MKLLVAYDGSISADAAIKDLRRAGIPQEAEALVICAGDGCLTAPHAASGVKTHFNGSWSAELAEAETLAGKAADRIRSYFPRWTVSSKTFRGSPEEVILDTCGSWHPDLLVVGSHGRSSVERLILGSVSLELVHKAPCSVRVTRINGSSATGQPIRLIIGSDGSAEAEAMIRWVAARSWPESAEAQLISVAQTLVPTVTPLEAETYAHEPAYDVVREEDERMRFRLAYFAAESVHYLQRAGLIATYTVKDGYPGEVIVAEANRLNADAIFVGARGHGPIERLLLGSVSSYVVTHAHCTVEVVRQPRSEDKVR